MAAPIKIDKALAEAFGYLKFSGKETSPKGPPEPPKPSLPKKLFDLLTDYAVELFNCEFSHYPSEEIPSWAQGLIKRIENRVMEHIANIEREGFASLRLHAPHDQMRVAVRKGLQASKTCPLCPMKAPTIWTRCGPTSPTF